MNLRNRIRTFLAMTIILIVRSVWWAWQMFLLRTRYPARDHYYVMQVFRAIGNSFPVTISYPNPISNLNDASVDSRSAITLRLDLCENGHQWYFRHRERHEHEWVNLVGFGMRDSEIFIDAGSNIGIFALPIAHAFPDRKVIAIDPLPVNISRLEENISINGISNIKSITAAVTTEEGPVKFYDNPINDGGGSLVKPQKYRTGGIQIDPVEYQAMNPNFVPILEVQCISLDSLITGSCVLKIDVEGAEVPALRSAKGALSNNLVNMIVIEVTNDSICEVLEILNNAKFDCFNYGNNQPIASATQLSRRLGNILCLRRESDLYDQVFAEIDRLSQK